MIEKELKKISLPVTKSELETPKGREILTLLMFHYNSKQATAQRLGIHRSTLFHWSTQSNYIKDSLNEGRMMAVDSIDDTLMQQFRREPSLAIAKHLQSRYDPADWQINKANLDKASTEKIKVETIKLQKDLESGNTDEFNKSFKKLFESIEEISKRKLNE